MFQRRKKSKENKLLRTVREFGENTSFHSIKYIVSSQTTIYEKVLWTIIAALGVCGSVYMTFIFWNRFNSNPVRITTQSLQMRTSSTTTSVVPFPGIPFPGVTVCSNVRLVPDYIDRILNQIKIPKNTTLTAIRKTIPLLMGYTQPMALTAAQIEQLELLEEVMNANGYTSIADMFLEIEPSCNRMLVKCRWEQQVLPCANIFARSLTKDGHCCSFNTQATATGSQVIDTYHTLHFGVEYGLSIMISPSVTNASKLVSAFSSLGTKVLIHHPNDYPGISSVEKMVGISTESLIRVIGTKLISSSAVRSLTVEQRNCLFEDDFVLKYFPEYRDTNCRTECTMDKFFQYCACVPFTYPYSGKPVCNITNIPCLTEYYDLIFRSPLKRNKNQITRKSYTNNTAKYQVCECAPQCNDVFYEVETSTIPLNNTLYTMSDFYNNEENVTNTMVVHVHFGSQFQTVLRRDTITSTYYLLSSFGGVFSLFLGCSFISILEIFYFFCYRLFLKST